jgi:hypothetical protein
MKRTLFTSLFLLLVATWAMAQYGSSSAQTPSSGSTSAAFDSASSKTVKGCLSGSDGNYMLTDKSGTAYQLKGDTSQLSNHVGHEIQVKGTVSAGAAAAPTGTTGNPSASTAAGASTTPGAGSSQAQQTLEVSSFKHLSDTCSATGAKGKSSSDHAPMSEKPPQQ